MIHFGRDLSTGWRLQDGDLVDCLDLVDAVVIRQGGVVRSC